MCVYCTVCMFASVHVWFVSPAVFGRRNHPDARLSPKRIDANGSLLQSQMPQARTDRRPTSLSLSPLSLWHKMICHSVQESALQGGRWHQFISTGLIQNIVSPSGRKQIKQTRGQMEEQEGKRGRKMKEKGKTVALPLPTSSIRCTALQ